MGRRKKAGGKKDAKSEHSYLKVLATYKCSGENCKKLWKSVHGWEREENIDCEFCGKSAKIIAVVDEMMRLDNYSCTCGIGWQSIHDENNSEQGCDCGEMVTRDGYQERFGRHFTFECTNELCKVEWEDFSITQQRTQRCRMCKCRGDIVKIEPLPPKRPPRTRLPGLFGEGSHLEECCDMCQDIIAQGKGRNCMAYRKVTCKLEESAGGGGETEVIIAIE
ncbi:unnamed protein product [Orchesella dallaii]|uniref:Uncharacterized protein n=1 Tax=Orchesella dallaii TaxID=48710 RepID=A0ABP1PJ61_9HEXA